MKTSPNNILMTFSPPIRANKVRAMEIGRKGKKNMRKLKNRKIKMKKVW